MHVLPRVEHLQRLTQLSILIVKAFVLTGLDVPIYYNTGICILYRNNMQYTSTIVPRVSFIKAEL